MKHISFEPRFVHKAGNDLMPGKIHTIRQNYDYWKRFEGKEVALFTWEGKPYQPGSTHKVFCVKRIVSVQEVIFIRKPDYLRSRFYYKPGIATNVYTMARNDGFEQADEFLYWFASYKPGKMAILHFTDFRY